MNDNASNVALTVSATTGAVTATGWVGVVNDYSAVIGLFLSAFSILVALFFHYKTAKWRRHQDAIDRKALRDEIIAELSQANDHIESSK